MARARSLPTTSRFRRRIWGFDASHRNPSKSSLRTQDPFPPKLAAMNHGHSLCMTDTGGWVPDRVRSGQRFALPAARFSGTTSNYFVFPIQISNSTITFRHCEPTGRANARPMTGSAKQSIEPCKERMDCFVACALRNDTTRHAPAISRHDLPESCTNPSPERAQGMPGAPIAPAALCAKGESTQA
jgi:hypothetical protein